TLLSYADSAAAYLNKGNHVWKKYAYIKMDDVIASVDSFLKYPNGCFYTYDDFLKEEYLRAQIPCKTNYGDPCDALRFAMIKEMYPDAKYGKYDYADPISKTFGGPAPNSIFTQVTYDGQQIYRYQLPCLSYPDTSIAQLSPQDFINIFNDSIAAALLPLHPNYCNLEYCDLLNHPYVYHLSKLQKASHAKLIDRFELSDIANNDPLVINGFLSSSDLSLLSTEELPLDSITFKRTLCSSESNIIEMNCEVIHTNKTLQDLPTYPEHFQDEYYQNLIALYLANRTNRISEKIAREGLSCDSTCEDYRITPPPTKFKDTALTTALSNAIDSINVKLFNNNFGVNGNTFFNTPITTTTFSTMANPSNSSLCIYYVDQIIHDLANCHLTNFQKNRLRDTLLQRFCNGDNYISM